MPDEPLLLNLQARWSQLKADVRDKESIDPDIANRLRDLLQDCKVAGREVDGTDRVTLQWIAREVADFISVFDSGAPYPNPLIDALERSKSELINIDPKQAHQAVEREYLYSFLIEMRGGLAQTLVLSARDTPDAITRPSKLSRYITISPLQPGQHKALALPTEERIFPTFSEAFHMQGGRVLLLGAPGAGKTTTLLQFACEAVQACLNDPSQPIPLFQSIHRWDHKTPLRKWAQEWVKVEFPGIDLTNRPLLYIFDGLDELGGEQPIDPQKPEGEKYDPRLRFLQAVAEELPQAQVVISCRELDYEQIGQKAKLSGAVKLLPLNPDQIRTFLLRQNQGSLWQNLEQDEHLLKLAETPLLLALLSKSVGGANSLSIADASSLNANTIFDFYIRMMFVHETQKRELPFTEAVTRRLLGKLGVAMWQGWYSISLDRETVQTTLGEDYPAFIQFACDMQFLRSSSDHVQFVHLKFRDFCAVPALIEALKSNDGYIRLSAINALGQIGDPSSVPALIQAFRDQNGYVRERAVEALVQIGNSSSIPTLIEALQDKDIYVRRSVASALGEIGDTRAVPALIEALQDKDWIIRERVAAALGEIGDASAIPALIEALRDQDWIIPESAAYALGQIGRETVPALIEALQDKDWIIRERVAAALGQIGDASAIPALIGALRDQDIYVRGSVADALSKLGDASAVPSLIEALKDPAQEVRWSAVEALGKLGDASAIPALIEILKDPAQEVRWSAVEAIRQLNKLMLRETQPVTTIET